ncbi:MAG TPA: hypothetical protein VGN60_08915 [Devosia sp.]|jgi:hypothetical protein|nr:hypothetical protein [Devosia sp.]
MRARIAATYFLLSIVSIHGAEVLDGTWPVDGPATFESMHHAVSADFLDPTSAQYKGLTLRNEVYKPSICGWVNARNSAGGYTQFHRFAYQVESNSANVAEKYDDPVLGKMVKNTLHMMGCPESVF